VSGPDHLAAVAPLSLSGGRRAWTAGLRWGVGHAAGVFAIGALALALREAIDLDALSAWGERLVGYTLIAVGLWGAWRARSRWVHAHAHAHGASGELHLHVHVHRRGAAREHATRDAATAPSPHATDRDGAVGAAHEAHFAAHDHRHAPLLIGALHGVAGSSHLFGIAPALALPSRADAALYVAAFGLGSVATMTLFSLGVHAAARRLASIAGAGERAFRILLGGTSLAAVTVGIVWLAQP
jgi:sulfite exporter TauE/SafE